MSRRPRRTAEYERKLKSEERRAIIWLGYLTFAVSLRLELERAVEAGQRPFVNFFCNYPCPHLTVYAVETLNVLIISWFLYTIFIVLYFSEDWFHGWRKRGKQIREVCRRIANLFWFAYPFSFGAFTFISAFSFLIPQDYQSVYWVLVIYGLTFLAVQLVGIVTGEKRTLQHVGRAVIDGFKVIAELAIEGLLPILERILRRLLRRKIPPKVILRERKVKRFLGRRRGRVRIRYWKYPD